MSELDPAQAVVYYYPNKMGLIVLQAFEEVLGHTGLLAVLNSAGLRHLINNFPPNNLELGFPFAELGQFQAALEGWYGPRSGHGLAVRAGRACFRYGLREFGPLVEVTDLSFRLLPLEHKLKLGANAFAQVFNQYTDQRVRVEEQDDKYIWNIERCPVCWGRRAEHPVCHLAVGILQEALYWVSGGKYFNVEETACVAQGAPACSIVIEKQALD
jgi:hypothetical protein